MDSAKKTWETHVQEATEKLGAGGDVTELVMLRADLARRLETAHERALADARQLAEDAARLARRLEEDGLGAVFHGNGFLGQAQTTREALLALESAREVFGTALRAQKAATTPRAPDGSTEEG